jgi:hypothetical protein
MVTFFTVPGGAPEGVAVTISGGTTTVYSDNYSGSTVLKTTNLGSTWTTIGSTSIGSFSLPFKLAVDGTGYLYVADQGNAQVQRGNGSGTWSITTGLSYGPDGMATDSSNNAYTTDIGSSTYEVHKLNSGALVWSGTIGSYPGNDPVGVAADGSGNLYVADNTGCAVWKWNGSTWGGTFLIGPGYPGGSGNGQLKGPDDVVLYGGNLYVLDSGNARVQEFNTSGTYITQFSVTSGPVAMTVDPSGVFYVANYSFGRIETYAFVP